MANGILGTPTAVNAGGTGDIVYTVPPATFTVCTINVANRSTQARNVRIALAAGATPTTAEYIEYDVELIGNGVLERSGIVIEAGRNVIVYSNSTDVTAMVYGIETATS